MLQEALADSQLQAVKAQLESRGFGMNADEAQAVQLAGGQQVLIPFGEGAHLVWTRANGQTAAMGLIRQGNKTLNVSADGQERVVRFLPVQKAEKLLRKLREKQKFQDFEGKLGQKGKRVGRVRVLFDETSKIAIVGIASEGSDEKIAHQVRIKLKAGKDDEPEDDAEPAIQATACGQATGEAVPTGAKMQAQMYYEGEGATTSGAYSEGYNYEGPQLCTSQWGYDYWCTSTTPMLSLSVTGPSPSLALPQTFINQQVQASFVIWNAGGGRLTGTVSVPAPFSVVSGASFSLSPGQPQEVVVRFSSATAGSFSQNLTITSNAGTKLLPVSGVAHKVTFSPATVTFGEGMFVVTEQCSGETGECTSYTKRVGLPLQGKLVVKNEGSVAVSLNLSTSAPFYLSSGGALALAAGQSVEVAIRFDPADAGAFTGAVQVTLQDGQGSLTSGPLTGTAHKIEVSPAGLDFGVVILGNPKQRQLTIKNKGVTTANLAFSTSQADLTVISGSALSLAPGVEQVVKLRFNPTAPGVFQRSLSVVAGTSTASISISGKVYSSLEEYLQELLQAYNRQRQECYTSITQLYNDCGIGAIGAPISDRDGFWLVGFSRLTPAQVINYQRMASSYSVPDTFIERLVELAGLFVELDSLDPDLVVLWYQRLQDALAAGRFGEEYALLLQDAQFARYHQLLGQLLETTDAEQIRAFLQRAVQLSLEQPQPGHWAAFLELLLDRLVREGHLTQAQADKLMDNLAAVANKIGGIDGVSLMDAVAVILGQFDFVKQYSWGPGLGQLPSYSEFVDKLIFILEQMKSLSGNHKTNETIKAWFDKLIVAGRGVMQGWLIMNIIVDLDPNQLNTDPNGTFIDIVAWKMIGNTRVVAFLKVDSRIYNPNFGVFYQNSVISLFNTLSAMINHVMASGTAHEQYGYGLYILGVIFTRQQDPAVMEAIARNFAGRLPPSDYPVFLVFRASTTQRYTVIVICPSGGCSPTMIQAAGDAACDFLAARIQSANLSGITHTCADGTEIDIKTINRP